MVMLIRNLDISKELVNGTRCFITPGGIPPPQHSRAITNNADDTSPTIRVERGSDESLHEIPMVTFAFVDDRGRQCTRRQFPLMVCYATTPQRAQGLTLRRVGWLETPPPTR